MIGFIVNFLIYAVIAFLIYFNLMLFFKAYRSPYPSAINLRAIDRSETPFLTNEKTLALEQELIKLDFYILGYTVLRSADNIYMMAFNNAKNNIMCLVYLNEKRKNIAYEFFLKPLSGKNILIANCDMPLTFDSSIRDFYRIPVHLKLTIAYLIIFQSINNTELQALPNTIDELLEVMSCFLKEDAAQKTQQGLLRKTKKDQEFQKISLKGALTILLRAGIPTGFYFANKEYSQFDKRFLK